VSSFRKSSNVEIANQAKSLLKKWKGLVQNAESAKAQPEESAPSKSSSATPVSPSKAYKNTYKAPEKFKESMEFW
jgi:hypothetical protein